MNRLQTFRIVFLATVVLAIGVDTLLAGEGWNASFQDALKGTTRLRVRSNDYSDKEKKILADINDAKEISDMLSRVRVEEQENGIFDMCGGNPLLEFYSGDKLIASFSFHHGVILRWLNGKWKSDVFLTGESSTFLVQWLADHGVSGPKDEIEEERRLIAKANADWQRWLDAEPASLRPFKTNDLGMTEPAQLEQMQAALAKEHPDRQQQILTLLAWFGSGAGPWSGFPLYESHAEQMLLLYPTKDIIEILQTAQLTEAQTEGAARLLGGWTFSQKRPGDLATVPATIKQQLLAHSMKSDDADKKGRAERAFSTNKSAAAPSQ